MTTRQKENNRPSLAYIVAAALAGSNDFAVKDVTVSFPEREEKLDLLDVEDDSMIVEFVYYKGLLYNGRTKLQGFRATTKGGVITRPMT
jgi:hypothetical protein